MAVRGDFILGATVYYYLWDNLQMLIEAPMRALLIGLAASIPAMASATAACSISDILIKQADWRREPSAIRIITEIVNNCSEPTGVQLQAVFRDADGKVVRTDEFWPASIRNIAPGESYANSGPINDLPDAKTMSLKVIEVRRWQ